MNGAKEEEANNVNVTDTGSPKIETIVEAIDPPQAQASATKTCQRGSSNGLQVKRPKIENSGDEYEPVDMTPTSHFLPDVLSTLDDCEVFGRSTAAQLRQMLKPQKILAQRLISEVCFRGHIQALSLTTTIGTQPAPVLQQVPQPVLPSYACKPLSIANNRPSEYFASHHPYSNSRQAPSYGPQVTVGSTSVGGMGLASYQNCVNLQQQHADSVASSNLGHSLGQNDLLP